MNQNQEKNLTIIVLTYNSLQVVGNCLKNLNFDKYKVVVVDNASKDGTVEFVKNNFPQAQLIELTKNIGYGNGNNVALEKVDTEFSLILNPDAMMFEKDIEIVLSEMKKNPSVAMAGPLVLDNYPIKQSEIDEKLANMNNDLATIQDGHYEKIDGNFSVRFLIGAALFMKISVMKKIGFFDKKIFLYYEDDELCGRVRFNKYHNFVVPTAVAFHIDGGGKSSGSSLRVTYKKSWHLTWSKMHWKEIRKGTLRAKRSALKFAAVHLAKAAIFAIAFNKKKVVQSLGTSAGAFSFLIGLGAFKKDGNPRG
jgi:N-acetylglucosaminyl-diphospho-decaprenol L-rhamnosyltransferase